jgi:hypothetical protein
LALVDREADPLDRLDLAVGDPQVADLEHGGHRRSPSPSVRPITSWG